MIDTQQFKANMKNNIKDIESLIVFLGVDNFRKMRNDALDIFNDSVKSQAPLKTIKKNYKQLLKKQSDLKLIEDLVIIKSVEIQQE